MHLPRLFAQINPSDRLDAVHSHFSEGSPSNSLSIVVGVALGLALLCGLLILVNRIQRARLRREELDHERRLQAKVGAAGTGHAAGPHLTLLHKQQTTPHGR